MRLRTVGFALLLGFWALAYVNAAEWQRMPYNRWECTIKPGERWVSGGKGDGSEWEPVRIGTAAPYPEQVEPADQYRWGFMWSKEQVAVGEAVYFRRWIRVDAGEIKHATLRMCAYGSFVAYLNGQQLLRSDETGVLHEINITEFLKTGDNRFAIAVVRGEKNYGLLVMGETELTWPLQESAWRTADTLAGHELKKRETPYTRSLRRSYTPYWTRMPLIGNWAWTRTEPGLDLNWDDTTYPTIQPKGGMPEYSTAYFQLRISFHELPVSGVLQILGDDGYEVYVNGYVVAVEKRADKAYLPVVVDITDYLRCHGSTIAAKVTNDWGPGRVHIQPTVMVQF